MRDREIHHNSKLNNNNNNKTQDQGRENKSTYKMENARRNREKAGDGDKHAKEAETKIKGVEEYERKKRRQR